MATGVAVSDACIASYNNLKLGKAGSSPRYILYGLNSDNSQVVVLHEGPNSHSYADFVAALPPNECRWAVVDFEFESKDAGKRNKILFIQWSPETSKIKDKMLFAGSKEAFKKKLVGVALEVQATDLSEIDQAAVLEKVLANAR